MLCGLAQAGKDCEGHGRRQAIRSGPGLKRMAPLELFFVLIGLIVGVTLVAYAVAVSSRGIVRVHRGEQPAWPRFHVSYYVVALLFIAFDIRYCSRSGWISCQYHEIFG